MVLKGQSAGGHTKGGEKQGQAGGPRYVKASLSRHASLPKKEILITDDEDTLRELIAGELKSKGYEIVSLASKREALEWCRTHHPDLIISDIQSPGMDGFQFLRLLKSDTGTKSVPIVFLTGFADDRNAEIAREMGATDFIAKPCKITDFQSVVERIIGKARR